MEASKRDESFQHELQDYIRRQKARGLQPNVTFRQVTADSAHKARGPIWPRPPVQDQQPYYQRTPGFPTSYRGPKTVKRQVPPWPKSHHSGPRPGSLHRYQKNQAHFFKGQRLPCPVYFWEDPSRFHWSRHQDRGQKRRHGEEPGEGATTLEPQHAEQHGEGGAGEENRSLGVRKANGEPVDAQKPKHRKQNDRDGQDTTKARRWSLRVEGFQGCIPEMDLWNEAVLGGYY
ncbi:Lysine-rich coiled-coil protein 1 [Fukomys damarensis]|uniref:Lysine-rich coiled-coil protein 1 n=2 Tax=Fukomys damarensis TaxID=885580 RepID=A0A091DKJ3_FUKDA|nr:Lysine-rich coiled-coil protein 1 [Fukomys damarensis]